MPMAVLPRYFHSPLNFRYETISLPLANSGEKSKSKPMALPVAIVTFLVTLKVSLAPRCVRFVSSLVLATSAGAATIFLSSSKFCV